MLPGEHVRAVEPDAGEESASLRGLATLTAYYLGLSVTWGALTTIVLPRLVEQLVPGAVKTSALSLIAGLQALVAIVVQPISGSASDRLVTPWGRRRPLMVVGVTLQLLLLAILALSGSYWAILVVMLCVELASNTAQGPYQGATLSAIRRVDPTVSLQLLGDGDMRTEAGLADARSLFPGALAPADRQLAGIYVLPSVAAMHRALPAVEPGAAGSLMPAAWHSGTSGTDVAGRSYSLTTRWLVVENVALSVFTLPTPSAADRAYLDQLTTALGEVSP